MNVDIISPSELIKCENVSACFQALYNFLFTLFLALAFLFFVYGALEYMLSGAGIFAKDKGKKRMINSIVSVVIVLVIPVILNIINPQIFKAELQIPKVEVRKPDLAAFLEENMDIINTDPSDEDLVKASGDVVAKPSSYVDFGKQVVECRNIYDSEWRWERVFEKITLTNIKPKPGNAVYINPQMKGNIQWLDGNLNYRDVSVYVTDCYGKGHKSKGHTLYGIYCDLVPNIPERDECLRSGWKDIKKCNDYVEHKAWEKIKEAVLWSGFAVYDERIACPINKKIGDFCKGAHFHIYVPLGEIKIQDKCSK